MYTCFCAAVFVSAPTHRTADKNNYTHNSGYNQRRSLCSSLRSPWGSLLLPSHSQTKKNVSLERSSSTFLRLLCKVKAVLFRTCCARLVLYKRKWLKTTYSHTHRHTHARTSLHLQKDIINNGMLCICWQWQESKQKRLFFFFFFFSPWEMFSKVHLILVINRPW